MAMIEVLYGNPLKNYFSHLITEKGFPLIVFSHSDIDEKPEFSRTRVLSTPETVEFFTVQSGRNRFDIVPYMAATNNHPKVKNGEWDYMLDYWKRPI